MLLLLFVLPVLYRYFSSLLSMLDGFAVTSLLDHLAHMVYQTLAVETESGERSPPTGRVVSSGQPVDCCIVRRVRI